jgi:lysophospholipase L1-like esterase
MTCQNPLYENPKCKLFFITFALMKRLWKSIRLILIVLVGLEIFLHFYNPFSGRVKNGEIILPKNARYEIETEDVPGLDQHIIHTKNSLGFRGQEPAENANKKIICMGGSTTECFYLSDGKDWPNVLGKKLRQNDPGIWLNNAGMDGQSTFGHLAMLKQYILEIKPDYIVLMCGLNDIGLKNPGTFDKYDNSWFKKVYNFLELPSTIVNIMRAGNAKQAGLNHRFFKDISKEEKLVLTDSQILQQLQQQQQFIPAYQERLVKFATLCKKNNIKLILVSQAILFSDEPDLLTNIYLGDIKTGNTNGKGKSLMMKMYNKATFDIAEKMHIPFINLSARLPKDSRFFYDGYHFSNDGAEMAADILFDEIETQNLVPSKK